MFGKVISGMEAIDAIRRVPVRRLGVNQNLPVTPVIITSATVFTPRAVEVSVAIGEGESPSKSISLENSRKKCEELGFETGTEAFGKCVLKLSK